MIARLPSRKAIKLSLGLGGAWFVGVDWFLAPID
jgi:hypothetical protein